MTPELVGGRLLLWGTAVLLVAAVGLPASRPAVTGGAALLLGCAVGGILFIVLAGAPRLRRPALLRSAWLAGGAAFEELVWRGVALAWLAARSGAGPALAATSAGFALAHRGRHGRGAWIHLGTGVAFGAVFVLAGLAAAVTAHTLYNLLVDAAVRGRR